MNERCRVFPCARSAANDRAMCDRHWTDLEARLEDSIRNIADHAQRIYVGRTCYPERRLLEHVTRKNETEDEVRYRGPRDHLAILHWSGSWREIATLEESLIHRFEHFPKRVNRDDRASGDWSGNWNCVYVSWAFLESAPSWDRRHHVRVVEHLNWPIVLPTEGGAPVIVTTDLAPSVAAQTIEAFRQRRKAQRFER